MASRSTSRSPQHKVKREKRDDRSRSPVDRRRETHDRRHRHQQRITREDEDVKVDLNRVKVEPRDSREDRASHRHPPHHDRSPPHHPRDQFREQRDERRRNDRRRLDERRRREEAPEGPERWGRPDAETSTDQSKEQKEKEKPSLALSGKLTEDTNTFHGVVIKYNEPPEARKPKKHWRFYPFKGETGLPVLHLHRQSAFLLGRDRRVADIPVDHPSCSKQHAAIQFRLVEYTRADGRPGRRVRPYVIDLGSANGTYVNSKRIEPQRYVELLEKDVVKFGFSSREYVLLHDSSDTSALEDDEGVVD